MLYLQIYYQSMQLDLSLSPVTDAKLGKHLCTAVLSSPPWALQQCLSSLGPQTHQGPPRTARPPHWLLLVQPSLGFSSPSICHCTSGKPEHPCFFFGAAALFYDFTVLLVKHLLLGSCRKQPFYQGTCSSQFFFPCSKFYRKERFICAK